MMEVYIKERKGEGYALSFRKMVYPLESRTFLMSIWFCCGLCRCSSTRATTPCRGCCKKGLSCEETHWNSCLSVFVCAEKVPLFFFSANSVCSKDILLILSFRSSSVVQQSHRLCTIFNWLFQIPNPLRVNSLLGSWSRITFLFCRYSPSIPLISFPGASHRLWSQRFFSLHHLHQWLMTTGCILAHYKLDKALYHFLRWLKDFVGTKPLLNEACRIAIVRHFTVELVYLAKKKKFEWVVPNLLFLFFFEGTSKKDFLYVPICAVSVTYLDGRDVRTPNRSYSLFLEDNCMAF